MTKAAEEIGATAPRVVRGHRRRRDPSARRRAHAEAARRRCLRQRRSARRNGSLAEVCDEGTQVIALGDINDVELYRSLIGHGVHDYLVKPVSAETVAAALTRAERGPNGEPAPKIGRLIAVIGARGGVGATTVATNLAWTLAHDHDMRVALVDLDLFFGTCGLALDLELGRGFREALENPARVDSLFIERAMVQGGREPVRPQHRGGARRRLQLRSVGADLADRTSAARFPVRRSSTFRVSPRAVRRTC